MEIWDNISTNNFEEPSNFCSAFLFNKTSLFRIFINYFSVSTRFYSSCKKKAVILQHDK